MTPDEPIEGVRMFAVALSDEEILHRVRETVEGRLRSGGMRDVQASPPPVLEDAERQVVNRAHAEAQKKQKDAEKARRKRKNLEHDELEKHHRQQRHDGLPVEPSPSPSLSDSSSDDDESEAGRKRQAEAPVLAPCKALKVSTSSTAQWVAEAQAAIQHGAATARADLKEPIAQGEATEAATREVGEETPTPREAEAHESDEAKAPSIAEATEAETKALMTSEAEAMEAGASRTIEAKVVEVGASETTEAEVVEASVGTAEPAAQEAETEAGQASLPPPVQDPPPS
ncbi:fruit protein pKIWI501-like [Miscanthus floridulus]|uniref:fruit protein pKIWI501-like n=1 Tax=Miscanthus floridulus TaxID=154761 RepID=UPI003459B035